MKNRSIQLVKDVDVIVIGLGLVGSAALRNLAETQANVMGFEAKTPGHENSSSTGDSRIYRKGIAEGAHLVEMADYTLRKWQELEIKTGQENQLIWVPGGYIASANSGSNFFVSEAVKTLENSGSKHKKLTNAELKHVSLLGKLQGDGVFDETMGILCPSAIIKTNLDIAKSCGATVFETEQVTRFEQQENDLYKVTTNKGQIFFTKKIITAAGSYARDLVSPHIHKAVELTHPPKMVSELTSTQQKIDSQLDYMYSITRQPLYFFDLDCEQVKAMQKQCPVFIIKYTPTDGIYGMLEGNKLKVGFSAFGDKINPNDPNPPVSEKELKVAEEKITSVLSNIFNKPFKKPFTKVCRYTTLADSKDFFLDTMPGMNGSNILVANMDGGHGAKFSEAHGAILAYSALTDLPLTLQMQIWRKKVEPLARKAWERYNGFHSYISNIPAKRTFDEMFANAHDEVVSSRLTQVLGYLRDRRQDKLQVSSREAETPRSKL